MKILKIIFLFIIVNLMSCISPANDNSKQIQFSKTTIKDNNTETICCQLKENIRYIDKYINDFAFISDSVFVITNKKNIYMYDILGNQIKVIGTYGKGPSEYISANQLYISNNYIYIWCETLLKLIMYGKDGSYVREFKGFDFAIQKFVVMNDEIIYFYIPGNQDNANNIKIYNLNNKKFISEFGKIEESDKLLFINGSSGGVCVENEKILYASACNLKVSSIQNNKEYNAFEILDSDFQVELTDNAASIINNNFADAIKYIHNNSAVMDIEAYDNNIYIMTEIGKIILNKEQQSVDYSKRKIMIYEIDSLYNPLNKIKYDYPKNAMKFVLYKRILYYISFDEEMQSYVLKKNKLNS